MIFNHLFFFKFIGPMSLFLDSNDCFSAMVIHDGAGNVILSHNPKSQTLGLPTVPVMKRHLSNVLNTGQDQIVKRISNQVVNVELNPIGGAFAYAALEYVEDKKYHVESIKHITNSDSEYLFKSSVFSCITEVFVIEISRYDNVDSLVTIVLDKIYRKGGDFYFNGLLIEPLASIVLIEQLLIRFDL